MSKKQPLRPENGVPVRLADYDPDDTGHYDDKGAAARHVERNRERLRALQEILYAEHQHALLIVLQGMDASGKDGTIEHVMQGVNPQGVQVTSFKVPTPEELDHDFLWRVHAHVPGRGMIGIFNRSHYEDVLVVRVNKLVSKGVWQSRYEYINAFEQMLADSGTIILKFFLHISKDEQKQRFEERLSDPTRRWKFAAGDLAVREKWDRYMEAYEDVLARCNPKWAPWYIVPANKKWYRNLVVSSVMVEALEKLNLKYPPSEPGLDKIKIPD